MRWFVCGPTGGGKSTLAAAIARRACVPLLPLDDIHWIRDPAGDRRRPTVERAAMLGAWVDRDGWVIEGVQFKWADAALERADRIVLLDPSRRRNTIRILRRFVERRLVPGGHPRGTWRALREELRWSADYHRHERALFLEKTARWPEKLVVLDGTRREAGIAAALRVRSGD